MHARSMEAIDATVAAAAGSGGHGVAYARLRSSDGERVLRVPFHVPSGMRSAPRATSYAAAAAVAGDLCARGVKRAVLRFEDPELVDDMNGRRGVPDALVLAYVRLRCALNAFDRCRVAVAAGEDELLQRARAEVALPS